MLSLLLGAALGGAACSACTTRRPFVVRHVTGPVTGLHSAAPRSARDDRAHPCREFRDAVNHRLSGYASLMVVCTLIAGISVSPIASPELGRDYQTGVPFAGMVAWAACAALSLVAVMGLSLVVFGGMRLQGADTQALVDFMNDTALIRRIMSRAFIASVPCGLVGLALTSLDRYPHPLGVVLCVIFFAAAASVLLLWYLIFHPPGRQRGTRRYASPASKRQLD